MISNFYLKKLVDMYFRYSLNSLKITYKKPCTIFLTFWPRQKKLINVKHNREKTKKI